MKTWICTIFGGGSPTYLVSSESEKRAWKLIQESLAKRYGNNWFNLKKSCSGLVVFPGWTSEEEQIVDINEVYAPNGIIKNGSFEGLEN